MSVLPQSRGIRSSRSLSTSRSRRAKPRYALEVLESRTLLSTLSFPSAGSLDYVGTAGVASDLTVSTDRPERRIHVHRHRPANYPRRDGHEPRGGPAAAPIR